MESRTTTPFLSSPRVVIGIILIGGAVAIDMLFFRPGQGVDLHLLPIVLLGGTLIAQRMWSGATAVRPLQCVGLWVWLGLACAITECVWLTVSDLALGTVLRYPVDYLWMTPVHYVGLFGVLGLVCAAAAAISPRFGQLPVVAFVAAFTAAWCFVSPMSQVHFAANVVLTLGAGVVCGRWAAKHPDGFGKTWRRTLPAMVVLVAAVGLGVSTAAGRAEEDAMAALPDPAAGAPNVLFIVLDTVRADRLGVGGYHRDTTPAIDRLARSGVVFSNAYSTAPWTLPSHVSMFTGRYPHEVKADWQQALTDAHATLAEVLTSHGYATGGFVGNLYYCSTPNGLARGFAHYEDFYATPGVLAMSSRFARKVVVGTKFNEPFFTILRNDAETVTDRFLQWRRGLERGRPFFAFLNYFDAHAMYIAPEPFGSYFAPQADHLYDFHKDGGVFWSLWSEEEQQGFKDAYDGCLRYIDHNLERLFRALEEGGDLENTLVVITADHGELFGEHNLVGHGQCLYNDVTHVPLIVRWPGHLPDGATVDEFVSLVDLPATVLDVLGAKDDFAGQTLAPLWSGTPASVSRSPLLQEVNKRINKGNVLPVFRGNMRSLIDERGMLYIQYADGTEELFDLVNDPAEERDLVAENAEALPRLRKALASMLGE